MNNNWDKYLDPPDEPPYCDGCGETLERDINGDWYCPNKFCPLKFSGVEKEMAEALVEYKEDAKVYLYNYRRLNSRMDKLKSDLRSIIGE